MRLQIRSAFTVCSFLLLFCSAHADEGYFNSNGVPIHYKVSGAGEPVVLIHGLSGSLETWNPLTKTLSGRYRVISLDCRGHGKSGKPHDPSKYGREMVEDVVRLMDHLKVRKAHVMGYSMGAMITGKLLTVHPDRLLTATMGGAAGMRNEDGPIRIAIETAESLERGDGIAPIINYLTPKGRPKPPPALLKQINTMLLSSNDPLALAALMRGFHELSVTEDQMAANAVPALALIGGVDPLKEVVDYWPGKMALLQEVVIPDADHPSAGGRPEYSQAFRAFLDAHAAPTSGRLFDGRSFFGWEGDTDKTWRIENGALVGGSSKETVPHNAFLATTREYTNFDLRLKFKLVGTGFVNGGVQFRSQRIKDPLYEMAGYQADMGEGYWGALYDESRRNRVLAQPPTELTKRILKMNDWNDYRILCVGRHIRLWLNGSLTVDYTETDEKTPLTGFIAMQIHGGGKAEASYKDITIKEL